ncbi:MAG: hypothetical protein COC04_04895, partial [Gammaproteobacteria bacterium]
MALQDTMLLASLLITGTFALLHRHLWNTATRGVITNLAKFITSNELYLTDRVTVYATDIYKKHMTQITKRLLCIFIIIMAYLPMAFAVPNISVAEQTQ